MSSREGKKNKRERCNCIRCEDNRVTRYKRQIINEGLMKECINDVELRWLQREVDAEPLVDESQVADEEIK